MNEFKISRAMLSGYYVAGLLSFFIFNLITDQIIQWASWLVSFFSLVLNIDMNNNGNVWLCLFLACFFVTFLLKRYIIVPLGMHITEEGATAWELVILAMLVLGFYIYLINQVFSQPMPAQWPTFVLKLVDGYDNTFFDPNTNPLDRTAWAFVPWFWVFAPIGFMFARVKLVSK